ncbi:MAG: response regulator [Bacteroidota bacterium]
MPFRGINDKVKILFAEDVAVHNMMAKELLRKEGLDFESILVETKETFQKALVEFNPDLVISDYLMPNFTGMEALLLTISYNPAVPVIILTGSISEEIAVECMRSGASNYVIKENLIRLPFAVKEALQKRIAISEQRKAMIALRESESRLKAITTAAGDAIIMIDNSGLISFWNPAAERILGYTEQEMMGKQLHELIAPSEYREAFYLNFSLFSQTGEGFAIGKILELEAIRKNGERIHVSLNLSAVKIKDLWHAVGIVADITERKRVEEELISAKIRAEASDRLKTAFIHNISHEVRTPLNGILGFSDLITQSNLSQQEKTQYSALIKTSSSRLLRTITSYMDISMIVSGTMQVHKKRFDLTQLMLSLFDQFRPRCKAKVVELNLQLPDANKPFYINSDSELISKTLSHLLDNAAKYTQKGEITFGFLEIDGSLEFFVTDTGIGIREEVQARIFEYFTQEESAFTRNFEGSGLGLSISRGLVELLGGTIRLTSEKGRGSDFRFTLPAGDAGLLTGEPEKQEKRNPSIEAPVILVAEDDESNYYLLEILLRETGIKILRATTGEEAVECCRTHPEISLVLMDIRMPEMNGIEATKRIKSFRKNLPVIAVTAFAVSGDEKHALDAGCDDYIPKPIVREKFFEAIRKFL